MDDLDLAEHFSRYVSSSQGPGPMLWCGRAPLSGTIVSIALSRVLKFA